MTWRIYTFNSSIQ